jgi:hypothetical protein
MSHDRKQAQEKYQAAVAALKKADPRMSVDELAARALAQVPEVVVQEPKRPHWMEIQAASKKFAARARAIAIERQIHIYDALDVAAAEDPATAALAQGQEPPARVVGRIAPASLEGLSAAELRKAIADTKAEIRALGGTPPPDPSETAGLPPGWRVSRMDGMDTGVDDWKAQTPSGAVYLFGSRGAAVAFARHNGDDDYDDAA